MFRPVRRKKRELDVSAAKQLLHDTRRGVLAVNGDDGYPYAVPINYFYDEENERILFHGARAGHKIDSIKACSKVCFTVYGDEMIRDLDWAPYVRSTVVFGRCRLIGSREETIRLVKQFAMKYFPDEATADQEIKESINGVQMFVIDIEHITGKEIQER